MTITDAIKAGASRAFVLIALGLAAGGTAYLVSQGGYSATEASLGHVVVGWGDAGAPSPGVVVVHATARALDSAVVAWGVTPVDGGPGFSYWRCNVVATPIDGGVDPGPAILPGLEVVYDDDQVDPAAQYPDGGWQPQIECWRQGRVDTPFPCACSTQVRTGITLQPGQWAQDGGFVPKACVEIAGSNSMPAECLP